MMIMSYPVFSLWSHECERVFADRLINDADRLWFASTLADTVTQEFQKPYQAVRGEHATLLYGNFAGNTAYGEITERGVTLQAHMERVLEDYNNMTSAPMGLVVSMTLL